MSTNRADRYAAERAELRADASRSYRFAIWCVREARTLANEATGEVAFFLVLLDRAREARDAARASRNRAKLTNPRRW